MSAKHTPGPWCFEHRKSSDSMYRTEVFSAEHGGIATCEWTPKNLGSGVTGTYREANARLIAAAPDLLEALQVFQAHLDSIASSDWRKWEELASPEEFERWVKSRASHMAVLARAAIAKATGQKGGS